MERVRAALASRNAHKLGELRDLLPEWQLELLEADEFPAEEGTTYYDNASAKARFGRSIAPPDVWVLGEDSGLEVAGLNGGPGVQSARFAPEGDFVSRLLAELGDTHGDPRRARYVCELVCITPGGEELRGTGTLEGVIAETARGSEGFGYDPVFIPAGESRTVAELGNEWKAKHSHRARAAHDLFAQASPGASS